MLCVIVPVYNESESIARFIEVLHEALADIRTEWNVCFVDDGSTDNSWSIIQDIAGNDPVANGIQLSRNFGKEAAMYCGLSQSEGDCCVCIDCDLQHPPEKIVEMYHL